MWMRVRGVRVPPHQSAELTLVACDLPSQGEAFLFAFGRCWCKFRGFCAPRVDASEREAERLPYGVGINSVVGAPIFAETNPIHL